MESTKMTVKSFLFLYSVIVVSHSQCLSRRCMANNVIDKGLYSAPQPQDCFMDVKLKKIYYETLSFNLQSLQFSSHIKVYMEWTDPDLAWAYSQYSFTEVLLPYNYIWLPNLTVNNAPYMECIYFRNIIAKHYLKIPNCLLDLINTAVQPLSNDILVTYDGTVNYAIQMYVTVMCDMNLFSFPFVEDSCIVAINGWNRSSCGIKLQYGEVTTVGGLQGEWQTLDVELHEGDRSYLEVTLHLNPFNALVSLVLPTALIMVVDLVSFALPLDGERNAFKIKLVFSFTMFLLILSKQVPEGGPCTPLIYYHFCFCLLVLVMSLMLSMTLSQLARTGSIWPERPRKQSGSGRPVDQQQNVFHLNDTEINSSKANSANLLTELISVQRISTFVRDMDKAAIVKKKNQDHAKSWDNVCFVTYVFLDIIYMLCALAIFKTQQCSTNKLKF